MIHTQSNTTGSPIEDPNNAEPRQPAPSRPTAATHSPARIVLSAPRLFQVEGEKSPCDVQLLAAAVRAKFAFLPQPLNVTVAQDSLVIIHPRESVNNCQQAARLAERALRRAAQGNHARAVELCRRALELQPSLHAARNTLARALVELAEAEHAKVTLRQILRLDPGDQWALTTLAGLHGQACDFQEAERLARLSLAIEPGNAWALETLATILMRAGRLADAADTFRLAIGADPQNTPARLGLARSLAQLQRPTESLLAVEDFFDRVGKQNLQGDPLIQEARNLCASVQATLARQQYDCARQVVSSLRAELEQSGGIPIQIIEEDTCIACAEIAWWNRAAEHRIKIETSFPEILKPHLLAHELMHVRLETQALQAGKARFFVQSPAELELAHSLFAGERYEFLRRGGDAENYDSLTRDVVQHYLAALANVPLDMVVEWNIRRDLPTLAPFQFEAFRFVSEKRLPRGPDDPLETPLIPRRLRRLFTALKCARALAADNLFGGTTAYGAEFEGWDGFELGQKLFGRFKSRLPALGPDGHYGLVDDFADLLGMRGWFHWDPVHTPPNATAGAQLDAIPSPEELAEILPEEFITTSRRVARMSREEALGLLEEIARIGLGGFDQRSAESNRQLQTLLGERYAGPELLCLVYAGASKLASVEGLDPQPNEPAMPVSKE